MSSGTGTAILWELAGRDNNLPFLIPLLKKHKEQVTEKHYTTGQTLLQCACSYGNREVVLHLMNMEGISLEAQDDLYGYTALHFACFYDKLFIIQEILKINEEKAEKAFNIVDKLGWNCLHHAAKNGSVAIAKVLLQHNCELNAKDKKGKIPIHIAAENGHKEILQYLFNHSPLDCFMVPAADKNGFTALHYAAKGGHQQCTEWLKSKQFSPQNLGKCMLDHNNEKTERPDLSAGDVANLFGHGNIAGSLKRYKSNYETWTKDIEELELLAQVKLCICGDPKVGKTALREALNKSAILAFFKTEADDHDDDPTRHSKGIEVQQLDLQNKVSYQLWDFAGQIESFITHHFFISTDNTLIVMVVNLKIDAEETRRQMMRWLSFVKLRNTGATYYNKSHRANDLVNFQLPASSDDSNSLQKVPVLVVASHLDQVDEKKEVPKVQQLVEEMKEMFASSLDVHTTIFSLNCLNFKSLELTSLKEHLVKMHSSVNHFQRKYPRVVRMVEECMTNKRKRENVKLLKVSDLCKVVRKDVNGLLSENQLDFVCKVLSNTGKIVYSSQAQYVCLDPSWLCRDILGTALAPKDFAEPNLTNRIGKSVISEEDLAKVLGDNTDSHFTLLVQILTSFEICYELKGTNPVCYNFPCFITKPLQQSDWEADPGFVYYHGRRLQCGEELDCFPPGLFNRLQVRICNLYDNVRLCKDAFVVRDQKAECLVKTDEMNNQITFIVRATAEDRNHTTKPSRIHGNVHNCLLLLDILHQLLWKLLKVACPNISMQWHVLSPIDLKAYKEDPYIYSCEDVVNAIHNNAPFINKNTGDQEDILEVLYCGCKELEALRSGESLPIAFLPEAIFKGLEELLGDPDVPKNWVDLCKELGMNDYQQLFKNKYPHCTEALLRKYGENPKRRVISLIGALRVLNRQDVMKWLQVKLGIYKKKANTS